MIKFFWSAMIALGCLAGLALVAGGLFLATTPRPTNIRGCLTTEMYHVHLCPKDPSYVRLRDISEVARNAVMVSEDGAFYSHHGFDWNELQKSFEKDLDEGEFARGGSTITQQLAKNVYLSQEKSLLRKVKEAMITVQLEKTLSKDEILEKYLNVVEFGDHLYGIGPAAAFYFHKPASQLTAAEGAFLAFLLPNPKKYSQSFRQKKLTEFAGHQVRMIVNRLFNFKKIEAVEHASALAQVDRMFGKETEGQAIDPTTLDSSDFNEPPPTEEPTPVPAYPAGLEPSTTE
jgi:monofunctional biosynthetic peptidoglycan transglycosylase